MIKKTPADYGVAKIISLIFGVIDGHINIRIQNWGNIYMIYIYREKLNRKINLFLLEAGNYMDTGESKRIVNNLTQVLGKVRKTEGYHEQRSGELRINTAMAASNNEKYPGTSPGHFSLS